ncbi:MAG: hypothetical protein WB797_00905 [Nocardioides sp.]
MTIGVRTSAAAAAAVLTLALGACGSGSSTVAEDPGTSPTAPSSSPTGSAHSGPACSHVWRDGVRLSPGYRGCSTAQGWVKAQVYECADGHRLVTYAHTFYARMGRTITRTSTTLAHDHTFRHLMAVCGA